MARAWLKRFVLYYIFLWHNVLHKMEMQGWARWWKHFRINHLYCTAQIMLPASWTTWGTMTLQHTEARCLSFQLVFVYQASSWFLRSFHRFFYFPLHRSLSHRWLDLFAVQFILFYFCVKKNPINQGADFQIYTKEEHCWLIYALRWHVSEEQRSIFFALWWLHPSDGQYYKYFLLTKSTIAAIKSITSQNETFISFLFNT